MRLLKAPEGCTAASVFDQTIEIVDGVCEVDDNVARELEAHGFKPFNAGTNDDPRPPADGEEMSQVEVFRSAIAKMDRRELFSIAKGYGVALTAKMTTEAMRGAMLDHVDRMEAKHEKPPAAVLEQVEEKIEALKEGETEGQGGEPDGSKETPASDGEDAFGPKV